MNHLTLPMFAKTSVGPSLERISNSLRDAFPLTETSAIGPNKNFRAKTMEGSRVHFQKKSSSDISAQPLLEQEAKALHEKAIEAVRAFKKSEAEVLSALEKIQEKKAYLQLGFSSLFQYAVQGLKLTEAQSYAFVSVLKKSQEVPRLKEEIEEGRLTVSVATRIVSVLTPQNQEEWIQKAETLSKAEVEKEIRTVSPRALKREVVQRLNHEKHRLHLDLSEEAFSQLKRAQELILSSQRRHRSQNQKPTLESTKPTLEFTLNVLLAYYLDHKDPLRKAQRAQGRKEKSMKNVSLCPGRNLSPAELQKTNSGSSAQPSSQSKQSSSSSSFMGKRQIERGEKISLQESAFKKGAYQAKPDHAKSNLEKSNHVKPFKYLRRPLPAETKHLVHLRDKGRCQFQGGLARAACQESAFLEIHHKTPVHAGGANAPENLITLCSSHHAYLHQQELA